MGVTVVSGRSGSGKSRYLRAHIQTLVANPLTKALVIVPGQLTFETEKRIMEACGVEGIFGLQVMSVLRLAAKVVEDTGRCEFVTGAERAMIASKALSMMNHPFHGADSLPDFIRCAGELIARMKSHRQTPKSLRDAAERLRDTELRGKLRDAAELLENYDAICVGRADFADIYTIAAQRAKDAELLRGAHVVVDGLDSASPAVMAFLSRVMAAAADTVAAFRGAGGGGDEALFSSERGDMLRFIEAAEQAGQAVTEVRCGSPNRHTGQALPFLEANLYRYPYAQFPGEPDGIALVEAQTMEEEADALCAGILFEVSAGRRFRDIAVAGGRLDSYLPVVKVKFALCGIPFFVDERRPLADNIFFDFLYSALCAAAGDMTAVGAYMLSIFSPLDERQRYEMDAYCRKYGCQGWHMMSGFRRGADAARFEALRARAAAPLKRLTGALAACGAKEAVSAVNRFLSECGVSKKLEALTEALDEAPTRGEYAYFAQVFDRASEALEGIGRVFGDMLMSTQALCGLVKTGFEATKIAVIPPTTDAVALFDISTARLPDIDVLFALGVQDGVWPARDDGPGILSAAERAALEDEGVSLGAYDLSAERLKVYSALVKPKKRLYISYHTQSAPAVIVDRVKRLFPDIRIQRDALPAPSLTGARAALLGEAAAALRGKPPQGWLPGLLAQQLAIPGWEETARRMLLRDNAALPLGEPLAAALYGAGTLSATRIEDYYRCPFRHFLDYGLRAQAERDYAHDVLDIGTYLHLALDIFARGIIEDDADLAAMAESEAERRMRIAAVEAARQHDYAKLAEDERFARQYALLTEELVSAARRMRAHFEGSRARIYAAERQFSDYAIQTERGEVAVSGKIDRIDTADGYFRVVDYKSSDTAFVPGDAAAGVSLQLPVYIAAARRLLRDTGLKPAGGYYMRIGDEYGESAEDVDKAARMKGITLSDADVLCKFSALLENGEFRAVNQALTKSGRLAKRRVQVTEEELDALLACVEDRLKSAAEAIWAGDTAISPVTGTSKKDVCEYCDYASVCRRSADYAGNAQRVPEPFELGGGEAEDGQAVE
jgi:ATP-dependent helicase/DNAse subunit B